jgi:hypothetical protein
MLAQVSLSRNMDVIAQRVQDETVLFDMGTGNYYSLNELGSEAWDLLAEGLSLSEIAARLAAGYDAPVQTIEDDLQALLDELIQAGLLVNSKAGDESRG